MVVHLPLDTFTQSNKDQVYHKTKQAPIWAHSQPPSETCWTLRKTLPLTKQLVLKTQVIQGWWASDQVEVEKQYSSRAQQSLRAIVSISKYSIPAQNQIGQTDQTPRKNPYQVVIKPHLLKETSSLNSYRMSQISCTIQKKLFFNRKLAQNWKILKRLFSRINNRS